MTRDLFSLKQGAMSFTYDARHAFRTLCHHPGFFAAVVLTLGFGIGINTATFSIVNAVLIRPLGFSEPDRLVALHEHLAGAAFEATPFSPPDYLDFARDQQSFEGVGAFVNLPVGCLHRNTRQRHDSRMVDRRGWPQHTVGRGARERT